MKGFLGFTALHWAALNGHKDVVISLLESGANPLVISRKSGAVSGAVFEWSGERKSGTVNQGRTPIEEAESNGHSEIAGLE